MPKRNIHIRNDNLKKWDLIENKSEMINKMLEDTFTDACLLQIHEQKKKNNRAIRALKNITKTLLERVDSLEEQFTTCEFCYEDLVKGEEE
tara:strand:+ start:486 stop:758 length:273 start_codon:yes stop_codon:yes gene_type:complete